MPPGPCRSSGEYVAWEAGWRRRRGTPTGPVSLDFVLEAGRIYDLSLFDAEAEAGLLQSALAKAEVLLPGAKPGTRKLAAIRPAD
jgi:hypothetical protein